MVIIIINSWILYVIKTKNIDNYLFHFMPVDEFELLHIGSISHKHDHVINLSQIVPLEAQMFLSNWFMCGTCLTTCTISSFGFMFSFCLYVRVSLCQSGLFSVNLIPVGTSRKKINGGIMSVLNVSTISHLPEGTLLKDFTVIWFTRVPAGAKAKAKTNSLAERGDFCKDAIKLSCCF